jgi:hypothetical protein
VRERARRRRAAAAGEASQRQRAARNRRQLAALLRGGASRRRRMGAGGLAIRGGTARMRVRAQARGRVWCASRRGWRQRIQACVSRPGSSTAPSMRRLHLRFARAVPTPRRRRRRRTDARRRTQLRTLEHEATHGAEDTPYSRGAGYALAWTRPLFGPRVGARYSPPATSGCGHLLSACLTSSHCWGR